ncbi:MAG: hypothetical protein DRP70_14455 [Spirochaetes bacterium]|nr:MAG: hypothetical protein DRP70_14455 [Spirochaetota bacterium]RKX96836.1 MAG: hypothetical protein DRZ90_08145 [Spirochaetota bacterium]
MSTKEHNALISGGPKDITDDRNFTTELQKIQNNQALGFMDKFTAKRQLMKSVLQAKQQEINHRLDSYNNYLLAKKDVEAKAITLEAQKAIMALEHQQVQMMKELGLDHSDEVSDTLIKAGTMLQKKLDEVATSPMSDTLKEQTVGNIRRVWDRTNAKIMTSLDSYMDELEEKERRARS